MGSRESLLCKSLHVHSLAEGPGLGWAGSQVEARAGRGRGRIEWGSRVRFLCGCFSLSFCLPAPPPSPPGHYPGQPWSERELGKGDRGRFPFPFFHCLLAFFFPFSTQSASRRLEVLGLKTQDSGHRGVSKAREA